MAFDENGTLTPDIDPLAVLRRIRLPGLAPAPLTLGREIPMAPSARNAALVRDAGGMSAAAPAVGTASAASDRPEVRPAPLSASSGLPALRQGTLAVPDPNDPKYQVHGGKRVLLGTLGALAGLGGHLAVARALNPYERAVTTYNRNAAAQKEQLALEDTQSQIEERRAQAARAAAAANRPDKPSTPEEQTISDLMTGENGGPRINPATNKPYTYLEAYKEMKQAAEKPEKTPEADKPLSDAQITQLNAGLTDRYKVLNPGKPLPPEYTLQKGALQKDYDRIHQLLQGTQGAVETKAKSDQAEQDRQRAEQDRQNAQQQKQQTERDKFVQPHKQVVDTVGDAEAYVNGGKATGPGDYALMNQFQEMIVAGQKAGIRFTQNEQHMLQNAQSWINSMRATGRHIITGSYFSDDQRKQMLDVMQTIAKRSQKQIDDYDAEHRGAPNTRGVPPGNRPPLSSFEKK